MAWTTAGLSWPAGCDPAEVTRTRPAAWWSSSAAAICDRPASWVQTNRTSGTSAMRNVLPGLPSEVEVRPAGRDEHDDEDGYPSAVTSELTSRPVPVNSASSRLPTAAFMRWWA
jgi:hypothetical protein